MPRSRRVCPAGEVFQVLNLAVARLTIFEKPVDYETLLKALDETWRIVPLPVFATVAMPNQEQRGEAGTAGDAKTSRTAKEAGAIMGKRPWCDRSHQGR